MFFSTTLRSNQAAQMEATLGTAAILKFFSGTVPANLAAAVTGTTLATLQLPSDYLSNPANGVVSKSGTWEDAAADASGYATHARFYQSDGTTAHVQCLVSEPWAASKAYVVGQQVHNNNLVYRATAAGTSAASGGPAGTTAGITDGTVTWVYVGVLEIALDNTNIAVGQDVLVNAFSYTRGNA